MYLRLKCSVKQKEKRRVEKECFNFCNESQAAELPEKGKLFPGRANHGVMPVHNLGSTAARVGRDLAQPGSPLRGLLSCCSEDHKGYQFQPSQLHCTRYPLPISSASVLLGDRSHILSAVFLGTGKVPLLKTSCSVVWARA